MSEKADHSSPAPLDMGKKSNEIRLWKANQAVRHGELRLAAQSTALTGAQTRATSLLTWVVPLMGVSLGIILNKDYIAAGWVLLTGNAVTAVLCATALAPTAWSEAGFKPVEVLDIPHNSELLCQEAVAVTYQESIQKNDRRMKKFTRLMQGAWWVFLITPPHRRPASVLFPLKIYALGFTGTVCTRPPSSTGSGCGRGGGAVSSFAIGFLIESEQPR